LSVDEGERLPIRLVQENGDTISLDATSVDIVVERVQSNFALPLLDAKKMGIDLNQSSVQIEIQGVLADDEGQEATAQATAILDFYQPQQVVTWGQPVAGGGGNTSSPVTSVFNKQGPSGSFGSTTGITGTTGDSGSFSGGIGGSLGGTLIDINDLGNRILQYWNEKYIDFPVAYWVEESGALLNPVTSGLQLWLKADALSHASGTALVSWADSSGNGRLASQADSSKQPVYRTEGVNGQPYVRFDGSDDAMEVPFEAFFNSEEFTVFTVAKHSATGGDLPILSSDAVGYSLIYDVSSGSNGKARATWKESSSTDFIDTVAASIRNTDAFILTYTMKDTSEPADAQSDTAKLFINGDEKATQTSGVDYIPNTSANLKIGEKSGDFFQGDIYEILIYNRALTISERENVEGYLSYKYGINLPAGHEYAGTARYSHNSKHVRLAFDKQMVASKNEPHGFFNKWRDTSMVIASGGVSGNTLTVTGGQPNQWFEPTESERLNRVAFLRDSSFVTDANGSIFVGSVVSVTADALTINPHSSGATLLPGDEIYITPIPYAGGGLIGRSGTPVIILPIKNADTFNEFASPEKAVGPEFPTHEDGSPRDGNTFTRTDEYITSLISKALTASYIDLGKAVNASGDTTMDKVFTTVISKSAHDHNCRLTITQQYASSLGALSDTINTTLGVGQMPVTQGFSGGRSGKRVKSGGDKAQDLLGILANSNNYAGNPDLNFATKILSMGVDFLENQIKPVDHTGDYIRGIQIPYLTHVTKGKNVLDSHVAQRNFFLTTEGSTGGKLSAINEIHASRLFSHSAEGHRKNGISGLVTDLSVSREAEMKAYEFSLRFEAADIIL
tara:strand:+ start:6036 stop:8576 length:2541 start_codon:yes stop_codon:yes gene_type:complete